MQELAALAGREIGGPLTGLMGHLDLMQLHLGRADLGRAGHHLQEAARLASRIGGAVHRLAAFCEAAAPHVRETAERLRNRA